MHHNATFDIAIIGAGPVGLAAAARLATAGANFVVLEAGSSPAASVREWGHVRMFSPWSENLDAVACAMLASHGWTRPDGGPPTGKELHDLYLTPLAALPEIARRIRLNTRVVSVGRDGLDKTPTDGRAERPFALTLDSGERTLARAVIDASGTWRTPAPLGAGGYPLENEQDAPIVYGPPDSRGAHRKRYAGKRVLVVGAGHSAMNAILDLQQLKRETGAGEIFWALRRAIIAKNDSDADPLGERAVLNARARTAFSSPDINVLAPFFVYDLKQTANGVEVLGERAGAPTSIVVDEIIAATGFRPDVALTREIRLHLDPWLEAPAGLAPLIDPNLHSCNSVPAHGADELAHPEPDYFIVGMKSYGRAPTFLLSTGYAQVASVIARLRGEPEPARPSACKPCAPKCPA